ncbi:MAG: SDR family NAD(P)-dependent oxidoreductase [Treponema sp.]|jgi:sorbitol-6-phosphate 2-dehydrogenase|nr:SDR family NAD(P)-dependent oxidoreductase [Treponema sp.]
MISVFAPLVRGLYINAVHASRIVLAGSGSVTPKNALSIDLESAYDANNGENETFNEEAAAKALSEAFAAWEFEISPSGSDRTNTVKKQPSSIVLKRGENTLGIFWIDRDIDSARRRRDNGDDSVLEEIIPLAVDTEIIVPGLAAAERSYVVKDRVAVVLGGVKGFGGQICTSLAASGAFVFIADSEIGEVEELASNINLRQGKTTAIAVQVDVTNEESVKALFAAVAAETGGLDICICSAEEFQTGSMMKQELESFRFTTRVNYVGYFLTAKYASRLLQLQHLGAPQWKTDIIQINSKFGLEGSANYSSYAGSKFGGMGLTASFALELMEYNIKVNSVCPGDFFSGSLWSDPENGIFAHLLREGRIAGVRTIADAKAYYESKIPMKRGCEGPDIMRAIYYIVEQEYETGQAVPVTGGQVMLH